MALQNNQEFTPLEVSRAVFPTAFRGYDQEAVRRYLTRLAESLEHQLDLQGLEALEAHAPTQDRIEELEAETASLASQVQELEAELEEKRIELAAAASSAKPEQAPAAEIDEQQAIAWLGQETARVLESARSAAADISSRAEADSKSLRSQAESELAAAQEQAASLLADTQAEAEERVAALTAEAEELAASVTAKADERAVKVTTEADEHAAKVTAEAEEFVAKLTAEAEEQAAKVTAEAAEHAATTTDEAEELAALTIDEADEHRARAEREAATVRAEAASAADAIRAEAKDVASRVLSDAEDYRRQMLAELVTRRYDEVERIESVQLAQSTLVDALKGAQDQLNDLLGGLATADSQVAELHDSVTAKSEDGADGEVDRLVAELDASLPSPPNLEAVVAAGEARAVAAPVTAKPSKKAASAKSRSAAASSTSVDEPTQEMKAIELPDSGAGQPARTGGAGSNTAAAKKAPSKPAPAKATKKAAAKKAANTKAAATKAAATKAATKKSPAKKAPVADRTATSPGKGQVKAGKATGAAPAPKADSEADSDAASQAEKGDGGVLLSLVEGFSTIEVAEEHLAELQGGGGAGVDPASFPTLVRIPDDPADLVTSVAARHGGVQPDGRRGDLDVDDATVERLPTWFAARDVALSRGGPNFRRHLRRVLNDDQSDVLDRLRNGRGPIVADELPTAEEQLERFIEPVRRSITEVVRAGARAGGGTDVATPVIENLAYHLAAHLVDRVRIPALVAIAEANHEDRELILDPIRAEYRDVRNISLPDLADDALHEAFAIGLYEAIEPGHAVSWRIDPRTDPDPVCEINRDRTELTKGEGFPSGHLRPLALPGCRCLVVADDE